MVTTSALAGADGDPFIGMVIAGRYAVLERLGAGSMGTVYRAHQEAMRRDVALKIVRSDRLVDPQAKGRFQQEAHATSLLTSVHTVTVFDFGEVRVEGDDPAMVDGSLFLAMELLEGESLGDRLKRVKRVAPFDAVGIVRDALTSLAEAHDKGVIHRDLKPDNLVLMRNAAGEEMCKVLDFGIAKVLNQQGGVDALETQAGTVFGTPRYMSPEQAQGKQLDARSDLYSLGVILYHMLLGKPPYTDGDAVVVMAHHIKTVPKRPTVADPELALPQDLEDLLMRVLDKDPAQRPQSAQAFIAALDALGPLTAPAASAQLTAVVGPRDPSRSRRVMFIGVAAAALIGLVSAMAVTSGTGDEASSPRGAGSGELSTGVSSDRGLDVSSDTDDAGERSAAATGQPPSNAPTPLPEEREVPPTVTSPEAPASAIPPPASAGPESPPPPLALPSAKVPKPAGTRGYEKFD